MVLRRGRSLDLKLSYWWGGGHRRHEDNRRGSFEDD